MLKKYYICKKKELKVRKNKKITFQQSEFSVLSNLYPDSDNPFVLSYFEKEILALVDRFNNSGQSEGSAPYIANEIAECVKKLCLKQPISPITGEDSEWSNESLYSNDKDALFQNKRCSALFKHVESGVCYYLDAIVFRGEGEGVSFKGTVQGVTSRQIIKSFPFIPKTFYVDVKVSYKKKSGKKEKILVSGSDDFFYSIKDSKQLKEVWEYYDKFEFDIKKYVTKKRLKEL